MVDMLDMKGTFFSIETVNKKKILILHYHRQEREIFQFFDIKNDYI